MILIYFLIQREKECTRKVNILWEGQNIQQCHGVGNIAKIKFPSSKHYANIKSVLIKNVSGSKICTQSHQYTTTKMTTQCTPDNN